jgi:hypothetical protein
VRYLHISLVQAERAWAYYMQVGEPSHCFPLVWLHAGVIVCVRREGGIPSVLKARNVELARQKLNTPFLTCSSRKLPFFSI